MILCLGIGNTNIRCAIGTKEQNRHISIPNQTVRCELDFISALEASFGAGLWEKLQGSVMCSVVPERELLISAAIRQKTGGTPRRIELSRLGIDFGGYRGRLGEDRALCCAAALMECAPPFAVVDMGTATTINFVNADRSFAGGVICAGVRTGLEALGECASLLPPVCDMTEAVTIGNDTRSCLISGALIGTAHIIEGYLDRVGTSLGGVPGVIVTGGNAPFVLPYCRFAYVHKPTLLMDALFSLYG